MDSVPVTLFQVETILKKIDDEITFKELDIKKRPYAAAKTLSMCMKNSIASVLKPDPKGDDYLLDVEQADIEPVPSSKDNYSGEQKVNRIVKVDTETILKDKVTPEPSLASKVR